MRVFLTGATGTIGSSVVRTLVKAGHRVTGLVRSAEKEAELKALGAGALRGDLKEPSTYQAVAAEHDACIHIGFEYTAQGVAADRAAIDTLLEAARGAGSPRSVVYTSGVLVLGNTGDRPADESASTAGAIPAVAWRPEHERLVLAAASEALATAVVRPGFVYGGGRGLIEGYFETATKEGAAVYVGDGRNRMTLVHAEDLAELYRLFVEKRARGVFHAVDGASPRIAELARAASEAAGKGGATRSLSVEEARKQMGPFADALCTDQVVVTRRSVELGWKPAHRPFLESAREVFAAWRRRAG
jgi:nucleoside-diphosphate-sugar epimerase